MKYLRKFNEEYEKSIEDWCVQLNLENYNIGDDNLVNVGENYNYEGDKLSKFPFSFGIIDGYFMVKHKPLETLEGFPINVLGNIYVEHCPNIKSLEHIQKRLNSSLIASNNSLETLIDGPYVVNGIFNVVKNQLTTLIDCPSVSSSFYVEDNKLTTLKGSPKEVGRDFSCAGNELTSLQYGPSIVREVYNCENNKNLISLEFFPDKIGNGRGFFACKGCPIYKIINLFGSLNNYKASIEDYNYIRGTNIIIRRFEKACENAGVETPDSIPGYKYI
jgi:hypothetical protein